MVTRLRLGDQGNMVRFAGVAINYYILYSDQKIYVVYSILHCTRTFGSSSESRVVVP
jgi:hypothetical protein